MGAKKQHRLTDEQRDKVEANYWLVTAFLKGRNGNEDPPEEEVAGAHLGLIAAVRTWRPELNVPFFRFAFMKMEYSALSEWQDSNTIRISRAGHRRMGHARRAGETPETCTNPVATAAWGAYQTKPGWEGGYDALEATVDRRMTPARDDRMADLADALAWLSREWPRDHRLLSLLYGLDGHAQRNQAEVAAAWGISAVAVSENYRRALRHLRDRIRDAYRADRLRYFIREASRAV